MPEKHSALIIASSEYQDTVLRQLVAPTQDAQALAGALRNPAIGDFEVQTLINETSYRVSEAIETFLADRERDELVLLYFSGHGIKDADGQLYFATTNTQHRLLRSTAIWANFVNDVMRQSRSRRQVLLLDCCHSGAFAKGMVAKSGTNVGTGEFFEGHGRVVLTASDAIQYSFEGNNVEGEGVRSVFTRALVEGLETGGADLDGDGRVSLDELYDYVRKRTAEEAPKQAPQKWAFVEGEIFIARNPRPMASELPPDIQEAVGSLFASTRREAIPKLEGLVRGKHKGRALAALQALQSLKEDDSRQVSRGAEQALASYAETQRLEAESLAALKAAAEKAAQEQGEAELKAEAERLARQRAEAERLAAEKAAAEKAVRERREAEQKAEAERLARQRAEAERLAAEKAAAEKAAREQREAEQKAEAERLARQRAEAERLAVEKAAAAEKAAQEQRETEEKAEAERLARQRAEAERLAVEKAAAAEKAAREQREAAQKAEAERLARQRAEAERLAAEKAAAEQAAREQREAELKVEAERVARQRADAERLAAERTAAAQEAARAQRQPEQKAEADRLARQRAEAERLAAEEAAAETIAPDQAVAHQTLRTGRPILLRSRKSTIVSAGISLAVIALVCAGFAYFRHTSRPQPPKAVAPATVEMPAKVEANSSGLENPTAAKVLERAPAANAADSVPEDQAPATDSSNGTSAVPSRPSDTASRPPSSPSSPKRISVAGQIQLAKAIFKPSPQYPPIAKMSHVQGIVRLQAVIGADGKVSHLKLIEGHPLLAASAMSAVSQWRYQPTLLNGERVEVATEIDVNFHLQNPTGDSSPPESQPVQVATVAASGGGAKVYDIGPDISPPVPIYQPQAPFTEAARNTRREGVVVLDVTVDAQGSVANLQQVSQPLGEGLDESAAATVRTWRFRPATRAGEPVAVRVRLRVEFRIS